MIRLRRKTTRRIMRATCEEENARKRNSGTLTSFAPA